MALELTNWDDPFGKSLEPSYLSTFGAAPRGTGLDAFRPQPSGDTLRTPSAPREPTATPAGQPSALTQFAQGGTQTPAQASASTLDPAAYDAKARGIARDLQAQGHTVKWQGDQLVVDGRPYIVAGSPNTSGLQQSGQVSRTAAPTTDRDGRPIKGDVPTPKPTGGGDMPPLNLFSPHRLDAGALIPGTAVPIPAGYYIENGHAYTAAGVQVGDHTVQEYIRDHTAKPATPGVGGGSGGGGGGGFGGLPKVTPYTPGVIPTDTPQFTFDQIIDNGPAAQLVDTLMQQILAHPESMDPLTVDRMKAASKEELAQMAQSDSENLKGFGFANNLASSPWYGAEQAAGNRSRDNAMILSNRNIDITAAQTNQEDRRAAAGLGAAYQNQRTQQRALAADTQLRAAAVATDRLGLREAVKQKSTELQISEQDVLADYIIGQAQVEAQLHGIDVGAMIDREKLKQAGTEFLLDLALRKQQLAFQKSSFNKSLSEQKRQFNLGFGLDLSKFEFDASQPPAAPAP